MLTKIYAINFSSKTPYLDIQSCYLHSREFHIPTCTYKVIGKPNNNIDHCTFFIKKYKTLNDFIYIYIINKLKIQ